MCACMQACSRTLTAQQWKTKAWGLNIADVYFSHESLKVVRDLPVLGPHSPGTVFLLRCHLQHVAFFILWSKMTTPFTIIYIFCVAEKEEEYDFVDNSELAGSLDLTSITLTSKGVWQIMYPTKFSQRWLLISIYQRKKRPTSVIQRSI